MLDYHQSIAQTSKGTFNSVEKSILSSKSSSESTADKIIKKQTETEITETEKNEEMKPATTLQLNKSRATVFNDKYKSDNALKEEATRVDPKVKKCNVTIKKLSKETINKLKNDLKSPPNKNSLKVQKKSKSTPSFRKSPKPQCPHCGKKYANLMALNYHKITFHVEEKETQLFSSSAYHEQMSFDNNVLKLNNAEGRRLSLETKSEASIPNVEKEEQKNSDKPNHNISNRRKSSCICDKPVTFDMLG